MELRDALAQIAEIRQQVTRTELVRGYRALPAAFSGLLAFAAALAQTLWLPDPAQNLSGYFSLWLGVAGISILASIMEMAWFCRRSGSALERTKSLMALGQLLPSIVAGALLLVIVSRFAPEALWMLPGLWSMLFSLGLFACWRQLPRGLVVVAAFYLVAGLACLAWAQGEAAFSPWALGLPFGLGQLAAATILYWTLERKDGQD